MPRLHRIQCSTNSQVRPILLSYLYSSYAVSTDEICFCSSNHLFFELAFTSLCPATAQWGWPPSRAFRFVTRLDWKSLSKNGKFGKMNNRKNFFDKFTILEIGFGNWMSGKVDSWEIGYNELGKLDIRERKFRNILDSGNGTMRKHRWMIVESLYSLTLIWLIKKLRIRTRSCARRIITFSWQYFFCEKRSARCAFFVYLHR